MILYGASGHCKVIIDILSKNGVDVSAILDDNINVKSLNGNAVCQPKQYDGEGKQYIVSVGDNNTRKLIVDRNSFEYGMAIHPKAIIDDTVSIDSGSVVMAGAVINAGTKIGKHCIINTSASIDHDCILDDFVHISPNTTVCGGINIGEGTQIGAGAVIVPNINIGKWCTIGAGTVVINDIQDGATVVGNPGRVINSKI